MTSERLVSLLEILRAYANVYASACYALGLNVQSCFAGLDEDPNARAVILAHLRELQEECGRVELNMTHALIGDVVPLFERGDSSRLQLHTTLSHICDDLQRELSLQLFVKIAAERRKFFDKPFSRWELIVKRFGQISRDVEEMNKCFALSRYTAAMFHAMQIAELGAIELGDYIGVTDPKKGWGPTQRKLEQLIRAGRNQLPSNLTGAFDFLEQMNREVDSMTLSWRHKIDHAANRLAIVPNTDFTPDISEHIMGAVRVFMLRLQEGMPA